MRASLRKYEKLLDEADNERVGLLDEISALSKENYQLRVELANKGEGESEGLIQELTA